MEQNRDEASIRISKHLFI